MTHADLVRDQLAHPPLGTLRVPAGGGAVRVGITGSGPELLVLGWSAPDLARERAAGARLLRQFGVVPGTRVANALPGALATPGALLLGDVVEELGALDVPLGAIDGPAAAKPAWELVDRVEPALLVLDPGGGARLLSAAPVRPRPWWQGIVWLQTVTTGSVPTIPEAAGFAGWQRTWLAVPEVTSFVGASCARGAVHLDDAVRADVVGGELILRSADLDYATGLRAAVVDCACGTRMPALKVG